MTLFKFLMLEIWRSFWGEVNGLNWDKEMTAWNFLKQLTCTVGAHSPTLSRRLIHYSLLVPSLSAHHKIVRYQWLPHFRVNLYAAVPNAKFSTASSSQTLSDTSLAPRAPYTSVLIHCPKDTAVSFFFSFNLLFFSFCIVSQHLDKLFRKHL